MTLPNKRFHAFLYLLVLFPLWWIQRAGAADLRSRQPVSTTGGPSTTGGSAGHQKLGSGGGREDCTRTLGYWKNHSAHADNPNQQIPWPISEETLLCGETWYDILHASPHGSAWIILAHQWIAAELNVASGASDDALGDALDDAEDLLTNNCGGIPDDLRDEATDLASLLDDFNNGRIGPGHCGTITDCNGNGIDDATDIAEGDSPDLDDDGIPDECQPGSEPFCEGTGTPDGGVECPCGNVAPPGSGEGCLNRDGIGALLNSTGVPSVSNDTLVLHVIGIPNGAPGFFFQGASDGGVNTFGNGKRCIGGPFIRLAKIAGQPGGNQYPPPGGQPISEQFNIPAGATRYYQVLYRDGGGPCGTSTNASNGLKVVWGL